MRKTNQDIQFQLDVESLEELNKIPMDNTDILLKKSVWARKDGHWYPYWGSLHRYWWQDVFEKNKATYEKYYPELKKMEDNIKSPYIRVIDSREVLKVNGEPIYLTEIFNEFISGGFDSIDIRESMDKIGLADFTYHKADESNQNEFVFGFIKSNDSSNIQMISEIFGVDNQKIDIYPLNYSHQVKFDANYLIRIPIWLDEIPVPIRSAIYITSAFDGGLYL